MPNPDPIKPRQWNYPGRLPDDVGDDDDEESDEECFSAWVELCSLPAAEADAALIRLESVGIPCRLGDEAARPRRHEDETAECIRVPQEYLTAAQEALARPTAVDEAEAEADRQANREDTEKAATWFCPRCDRQTLERLPLSPRWRNVRLGCLAVLILPPLALLIAWDLASEGAAKSIAHLADTWATAWMITVAMLTIAILTAHRDRRCSKCGWSSARRDADRSEA